jgi:hypothetical protein
MMPLKGRCGVAVVGEPGGETVMLFYGDGLRCAIDVREKKDRLEFERNG